MNRITLLKILKTKPFSFTVREIEEIMDEELSKDPKDMDTELIDICVDVLDKAYSKESDASNPNKSKIKSVKARRVLLIAAILIFVLSLSISASAKYFNIDASEKVVQFINNHLHINLGNANTDADNYSDNGLELISNLKEKGFENVILPSVLISKDYSTKITTYSLENIEQATIDFKSNQTNFSGAIIITNHINNNDNFAIGQRDMLDSYNQVKQISVNGMDVLIFNDGTNSVIFYIDKNIEYFITINCDFESAIEIAETLK
ncbi:MAG: DUF4367 domain-containing protein [Ruminococcus sp.]|nr:DUF4367 domain-containing protein [Ruminococcus sp.]